MIFMDMNKEKWINIGIVAGFILLFVALFIYNKSISATNNETYLSDQAEYEKYTDYADDFDEDIEDEDDEDEEIKVTESNESDQNESSEIVDLSTLSDSVAIATADDLVKFANAVSDGDTYENRYVYLTDDIDLAGFDFIPIGFNESGANVEFLGTFDGRGHYINNMTIPDMNEAGLFYRVGGKIFNLVVGECDMQVSECGGGIAAYATETSVFANVLSLARVRPENINTICGAVAGSFSGTMINGAMMIDRGSGNASKALSGEEVNANIQNSYTTSGSRFKLRASGNENTELDTRTRGCKNLNARLPQLSLEYPEVSFYKWELMDEFPYISIYQDEFDSVMSVYVKKGSTNYDYDFDFDNHMWVASSDKLNNFEGCNVVYITRTGEENEISVSQAPKRIGFTHDGVESYICAETVKISDIEHQDSEVVLDFATIDNSCPKGAKILRSEYYDEEGRLSDAETLCYIAKSGTYRLTGNLDGAIIGDVSKYGDNGLNLILDNVNISSVRLPAIGITNKNEDRSNPGVSITLVDDTYNELSGVPTVNIYSHKKKSEGVLSIMAPLYFYGDTGVLYIDSSLECLESSSDMNFYGGTYKLSSSDDLISGNGSVNIYGGKFDMFWGDGGIDYDNVFINGGMLVGNGIVEEKSIASDHPRYDGAFMAFSGYQKPTMLDSKQWLVMYDYGDDVLELMAGGEELLVTDLNNKPIFSIFPYEGFSSGGFTYPDINNSLFNVYIVKNVEGEEFNNVHTNITGYEVVKQLTAGGIKDIKCTEPTTLIILNAK